MSMSNRRRANEFEKLPASVESQLRLRAFRLFYNKIFRDERDQTVRFVKAIVASARNIHDHQAMAEWCRDYCKRPASP